MGLIMKGWLTVLAWQSIVASGGYLSGTMIQGLLILNYPNYVPQQWHGTLLFWATILISVFVNTVVSNLLPQIEGLIFGLHVLGFLAILIVLTYMAPHGKASEIFTLFLNQGDWGTQGLSFMIGLIGISFSFVGKSVPITRFSLQATLLSHGQSLTQEVLTDDEQVQMLLSM